VGRARLDALVGAFLLHDFPDFSLMVCRGDLSGFTGPFVMGDWLVPIRRLYPRRGVGGSYREDATFEVIACADVMNPFWVYCRNKWETQLVRDESAVCR
jgi:hypothetical protein